MGGFAPQVGLWRHPAGKGCRSRREARDALLSWHDTFAVVETSAEAMLAAADLATDHQLGMWDAVILSAARERGAGCCCPRMVNPFGALHHTLLQALLIAPT